MPRRDGLGSEDRAAKVEMANGIGPGCAEAPPDRNRAVTLSAKETRIGEGRMFVSSEGLIWRRRQSMPS